MVVKFIIAGTGPEARSHPWSVHFNRVIFGDKHYEDDFHSEVVKRHEVPLTLVRGGGLADLESRRIFGTSYGLGAYNALFVRQLLPGWQVDPPSNY